jgi:hypothetical protein
MSRVGLGSKRLRLRRNTGSGDLSCSFAHRLIFFRVQTDTKWRPGKNCGRFGNAWELGSAT